MAQIIRLGDVQVECVAMVVYGISLAELDAQAVVARQYIVESFQLLALSAGSEKEEK